LTHREEDNRVRRGKVAAKGATVIFWRLAGGEEDELLALRVLLFDLVAIFAVAEEMASLRTLSAARPLQSRTAKTKTDTVRSTEDGRRTEGKPFHIQRSTTTPVSL